MRTEEQHRERKIEIMKKCFDCLSENGLAETSVRKLAKAAGISAGNIYTYFDSVDDLIIETTNYCAQLIDDDFLKILPNNFENLKEELLNVDYSKLKRNSKKYRFVMNVYISPKYHDSCLKLFKRTDERYDNYTKSVESKIGLPHEVVQPLFFTYANACLYYTLFEDSEHFMKEIEFIAETTEMMREKYKQQLEINKQKN